MAQCIVNYWGGLEVIRTDFIALYCIVPNRNLQGLPKHLNGHPRVSEKNLLPQKTVWRSREASRPPGDRTLEGPRIRPHQDFPARTRPHQTPHHRGEGGGFLRTRPHTTGGEGGRGSPTHNTPHHRQKKEGGGFPIKPTATHTTKGGGFPHHLEGVGGPRSA